MTRVFYCSTLFGALSVAAGIDAGMFGATGERRVLIVSNNGPTPEVYGTVDATPGFDAVRDRFDAVHSWNDIIAPQHPAGWSPRGTETPMLQRHVAAVLGLDAPPAELVVESIAVDPAQAIAKLVPDCPITVYSDGLMSYGPTRSKLPLEIHGRIERLLYLDLVPGLTPMLLREYGVVSHPVPMEAFTKVLQAVPGHDASDEPVDALILGQYLSALDLVTPDEEAGLHADMLKAVVAGGAKRVIFKPHPAAGPAHARQLREAAAGLDVELEIATDGDPAEITFRDRRPALVVGCFSTALATAARVFDIPVATMGAGWVLKRLKPYQNSNRIPVTIVAATVPHLGADGGVRRAPVVDIGALVEAVGHCMQPLAHPSLRAATAAYVAEHGEQPYFTTERLVATEVYPPDLRRRAKTRAAIYVGSKRRAELKVEGRRRAGIAAQRASAELGELRKHLPR